MATQRDALDSDGSRAFHYRQLAGEIEKKNIRAALSGRQEAAFHPLALQQTNLSISTVCQAYIELKTTGFVEAQPKSGYYVSSLVISGKKIAVEAPIDFLCKNDLEWVGEKHKAGSSFRLLMAAFYDLSDNGKMEYVLHRFSQRKQAAVIIAIELPAYWIQQVPSILDKVLEKIRGGDRL